MSQYCCHLYEHACVPSFAVPAPNVHTSPPDEPVYAGGSLTMSCIITLPSAVDSGVTVSAMWSGPSGILTTSSRIMLSETITSTSPYTLQSTLVITNIDQSQDDGSYTCSAAVTSLSSYIIGSNGLATVDIAVEG